MSKEVLLPYICPEYKQAVSNLMFSLEHPEYYSPLFPPKKRYLFFGQSKLNKKAQLNTLLEPYKQKYNIKEVVLDIDHQVTQDRLLSFTIEEGDIIVIQNIHYFVYALKNAMIQKFAHGLHALTNNVIIGVSDIPVDPSDIFYRQFDEFVPASLPTLDHLDMTFKQYFESLKSMIQTHTLPIDLNVSEEDYTWLAQQSTHCHDEDVAEFMHRIYHYAMDRVRQGQRVTFNRDTFEDLNNGFLYSMDREGTLSITQRDATQEQNVYTSMSNMSVQPRKRPRSD